MKAMLRYKLNSPCPGQVRWEFSSDSLGEFAERLFQGWCTEFGAGCWGRKWPDLAAASAHYGKDIPTVLHKAAGWPVYELHSAFSTRYLQNPRPEEIIECIKHSFIADAVLDISYDVSKKAAPGIEIQSYKPGKPKKSRVDTLLP